MVPHLATDNTEMIADGIEDVVEKTIEIHITNGNNRRRDVVGIETGIAKTTGHLAIVEAAVRSEVDLLNSEDNLPKK